MADARTTQRSQGTTRIGCVAYLNAKPLIHGVDRSGIDVELDVPARLLEGLVKGTRDVSLCPVIDCFKSPVELEVLTAGCIACHGPTLTVRLFSRVPIETLTVIHADTESHTSVVLLRVLMREVYGRWVELVPWSMRDGVAISDPAVEAVLLIGDKVITAAPPSGVFKFEMDLGEAWAELTGLPFVFAAWLCRPGRELSGSAAVLRERLDINMRELDALVERYAAEHGWSAELAKRYLGGILRYRLGEAERRGIARFAELAALHGLIDKAYREPTYRDA